MMYLGTIITHNIFRSRWKYVLILIWNIILLWPFHIPSENKQHWFCFVIVVEIKCLQMISDFVISDHNFFMPMLILVNFKIGVKKICLQFLLLNCNTITTHSKQFLHYVFKLYWIQKYQNVKICFGTKPSNLQVTITRKLPCVSTEFDYELIPFLIKSS